MDCDDHRLGVSVALLHDPISREQVGAFHESFWGINLESAYAQESFDKHLACLYNEIS